MWWRLFICSLIIVGCANFKHAKILATGKSLPLFSGSILESEEQLSFDRQSKCTHMRTTVHFYPPLVESGGRACVDLRNCSLLFQCCRYLALYNKRKSSTMKESWMIWSICYFFLQGRRYGNDLRYLLRMWMASLMYWIAFKHKPSNLDYSHWILASRNSLELIRFFLHIDSPLQLIWPHYRFVGGVKVDLLAMR